MTACSVKDDAVQRKSAVEAAEQNVSFFLNIFAIAGQLFILYYVYVSDI